ncbi:helix-turn-helix domain-containing protein [Nocardia abscessus]|uniref:helix-turn-helix domain-containing protein n=1 Tax=Nocardia abscessus TaxID=120957 RepID=UPI002456587D|nr:helix-turn-helix transcriptional regulator [Nocardia abscessus]
MDTDRAVGKRLEHLRMTLGLSQEQMSERLRAAGVNWSQGTLSRVETGQRAMRFTEALEVANALNIDASELAPNGGGFASLARKIRRELEEANAAIRNAESQLGVANKRRSSIERRAQIIQLCVELSLGRKGPYTVGIRPVAFIQILQNTVWFIDPARAKEGGRDALRLLADLGVHEAAIRKARARVDADYRQAVKHDKAGQPWAVPPYYPVPSVSGIEPLEEDSLTDIQEKLTLGIAAELFTKHFPYVRFGPVSGDNFIDGLERQTD